ncbi:MAG: HAMP domain-containing sensor histidine kinase [Bacteroidia bacterium]|nr:HAMP domain-containing sensor histidine kinase [Bacteroidia bacterium]
MRVVEDILANNFDEIRIAQLIVDDNCNIVKYNKYAKEYVESRSKYKIEELPFQYALSEKMLNAVKSCTPCSDTFYVNYDSFVAHDLQLNDADQYYLFFAEYEPVVIKDTGNVCHYFMMKDVTDVLSSDMDTYINGQKFRELMVALGVAHIDFKPNTMTVDVVGGRNNYNEVGISLDSPIKSLLHPDDLRKSNAFFLRAAKDRSKKHSTMVRVYSHMLKDYRYFSFVLNPIRRPDGTFVKFSGFCIDVTDKLQEMKKHDEKLNLKVSKLEKEKIVVEQSKSNMDHMLSVMGHDLRSPLSAIMGFGELMVNVDSHAEREEIFGYIKKSVNQMFAMVNDILESTRLDAGTIKYTYSTFPISEVVNDVYMSHIPLFRENTVKLEKEIEGGDVEIETDRMRLTEILNNFISNAIKYTYNGTITLCCKIEEDGVYFHVIDTGVGISKKDCEKVFEKYEMLDSEISGTGLGLYICRELAHGLGGKVGCISDKGKGCDFWLWLPR